MDVKYCGVVKGMLSKTQLLFLSVYAEAVFRPYVKSKINLKSLKYS